MAFDNSFVAPLVDALLAMDRLAAEAIMAECLASPGGVHLLEESVFQALQTIGEGWEQGASSLAQMFMSGLICEEWLDRYLPLVKVIDSPSDQPRIALAVLQDHHRLGKRMVDSVLHTAGLNFADLGEGLSPEELVAAVRAGNIEILLISTLMLPSALAVRQVVDLLKASAPGVKVIVGGAPFRFDPELWRRVGADGFGHNASDAPAAIERVVNRAHE